jgi:hypothetical protein
MNTKKYGKEEKDIKKSRENNEDKNEEKIKNRRRWRR